MGKSVYYIGSLTILPFSSFANKLMLVYVVLMRGHQMVSHVVMCCNND